MSPLACRYDQQLGQHRPAGNRSAYRRTRSLRLSRRAQSAGRSNLPCRASSKCYLFPLNAQDDPFPLSLELVLLMTGGAERSLDFQDTIMLKTI